MKISTSWLSELHPIGYSPEELSDILTLLGLEVEGIHYNEKVKGSLNGVVVGHVLSVAQHPNADRLRLCKVDVGQDEPLAIVCGAPNVAEGQKVAVALSGTTLYPTEGEPITLKKSKIRGEESNGMICAEDELGIGKSHEGIMVLPDHLTPGTPVAQVLGLSPEPVLEIGLTPNRTDAMSHYGVARDLYAYGLSELEIENPRGLAYPDLPMFYDTSGYEVPEDAFTQSCPIQLTVEVPDAAPVYHGLVIEGLKVGPSPEWLQEKLVAIGQRPINNVVDVTNYILHEIGQPLHAFDLAKIGGKRVIVRSVPAEEPFVTLDKQTRKLLPGDTLICDATQPMCIGGIMGGAESGVTDGTTAIFLESAYFNPVGIRKTSKRLDLFTDTAYRFSRGTDPDIVAFALKRAATLIMAVAGGVATQAVEFQAQEFPPREVKVDFGRALNLIGQMVDRKKFINVLGTLDIALLNDPDAEELVFSVPAYRTDVTRMQDVLEEFLRVYGYNKIEPTGYISVSPDVPPVDLREVLRNHTAHYLAAQGWAEVGTNSLTSAKWVRAHAVALLNPLSEELNHMRQSMLPSHLEVAAHNQHRQVPDVRIFEFGHVYFTQGEGFAEPAQLALLVLGSRWPEHWDYDNKAQVSLFHLKGTLEGLIQQWGLVSCTTQALVDDAELAYGLTYTAGKLPVARLGRVRDELAAAWDLKGPVYATVVNWDAVLQLVAARKTDQYVELPKFPSVRRDLSLHVAEGVTYDWIEQTIRRANPKLVRDVCLFDVYAPKGSQERYYAIGITLQDDNETLTDTTVDALIQRVLQQLATDGKAVLRQ